MALADVAVHRGTVQRRDAAQEVAREVVPTGRRSGVRPICGDGVVDGRLVDAVVGHADECGEYHGCDPVDLRGAERCPSEADKADGLEGYHVKEPPEAGFRSHGVGAVFTPLLAEEVDGWKEGEVG